MSLVISVSRCTIVVFLTIKYRIIHVSIIPTLLFINFTYYISEKLNGWALGYCFKNQSGDLILIHI